MIRKNLRLWIVITALPAAALLVILIVSVVSFFHAIVQPRIPLESGGLVTKYEGGTFRIFLEDSMPPTLSSYPFTFTNTVTQNRVVSSPPARADTLTLGQVVVDGEIVSGTFLKLVAVVELEAGTYIIRYPAWIGSGFFVWGDNIPSTFTVFRLIVTGNAFLLLAIGLIIMTHDYREQKKR